MTEEEYKAAVGYPNTTGVYAEKAELARLRKVAIAAAELVEATLGNRPGDGRPQFRALREALRDLKGEEWPAPPTLAPCDGTAGVPVRGWMDAQDDFGRRR